MKKIDKEEIKSKFSLSNLKELRKNKKGRAKIELTIYLIFFVIVIIFARISNQKINNMENNIEQQVSSFINEIKDNYEYDMNVTINNDIYNYHGKVLGNNSILKRTTDNEEKTIRIMNNKYYELDNDGNYILTTIDEVYPNINYNYININSIKNFINSSIKEENIYKIKVSDIILNNNSEEYITIKVDENNKNIEIDYTNLFKIKDETINSAIVTITYSNIGNIISLEEQENSIN